MSKSCPGETRRPTGCPQNWHTSLYALTSSKIDRFTNFFHSLILDKKFNNTVTKDSTIPQVSRVLAATDENKMASIATHFKKLTTGNNVFILSYYLK